MARKRIDSRGQRIKRSILGLLAESLLMSSCASTDHRREALDADDMPRPADDSEIRRRIISQMLAAVSDSDRQRFEQFAKSEADAIKRVASWRTPLVGMVVGGIAGPIDAVQFGLLGFFKVVVEWCPQKQL